jgi:hypothetical protein
MTLSVRAAQRRPRKERHPTIFGQTEFDLHPLDLSEPPVTFAARALTIVRDKKAGGSAAKYVAQDKPGENAGDEEQ